jgi:putative transposase
MGVAGVCRLLGFSRQAYYKHKTDRLYRQQELLQVRDLVMRIRGKMPRIGTRKLFFLIQDDLRVMGIKMGRDLLFEFLRAEHLLIHPKRSYVKTTNSKHWMKKYPNLITQRSVLKPEQVWVSDITYIRTGTVYNYLSLVTDLYSKKIMGYAFKDTLAVEGPMDALSMALKNRKYNHPLIHHSDRGLQYCSSAYVQTLIENDIAISMTQNGDPYENAVAERVNGILKYEFLLVDGFSDSAQARMSIADSVRIYNEARPHLSCQMLTPNQAHLQDTITPKKWIKKPRKHVSSEVKKN